MCAHVYLEAQCRCIGMHTNTSVGMSVYLYLEAKVAADDGKRDRYKHLNRHVPPAKIVDLRLCPWIWAWAWA